MHRMTAVPEGCDAGAKAITLVPALLQMSKLVRAVMALSLAELGLQPGQDEALLALDRSHPTSASDLAVRLGVRSETASKLLARLVQQRLAIRVENMIDARSMVVVITASGCEIQARLRVMMARIEHDLRASIDDDASGILQCEVSGLDERLAQLLRSYR